MSLRLIVDRLCCPFNFCTTQASPSTNDNLPQCTQPPPRFAEACRIQSFLIFALNPSPCIQLLLPVPACRVCSTWGHTTGNEIQFSVQCCFAASLSCYIPHPLRRKGARTNRHPCMIWWWPRRAKWNYSAAVQTIPGPPFYYIPTSFIVCSPLLVKTCSWASVFKPRIV